MKFKGLLIFGILAFAGSLPAQTVNNPGFETDTGGTPLAPGLTRYTTGQSVGGAWTVGGSDVLNIASTYTEASSGVGGGTLVFNPNSGGFALDITGAGNTGANTITQSINFSSAGTFFLNFFLGRLVTNDSRYLGAPSVSVFIDNSLIATVNYAGAGGTSNLVVWEAEAVSLGTITAGFHDLMIRNNSLDTNYVGLDDFGIVPEPGTVLGGVLASLLLVGFWRKRQQSPSSCSAVHA